MTKAIDALNQSVDYQYNAIGQLTKIIAPSGGAKYTTMTHDTLGRMTVPHPAFLL
jgi:YD repeat-containing protein